MGRRFIVDRIVHAGEGAWVVAARDRLDEVPECALKVALGRDRGQGRAQRLEAEYRILADLRHPGIPMVIDFGADLEAEASYLALEWIEGAPLSERGEIVPSHALALFLDVLRTLVYLHDRQVIHFDVKPANIVRDDRRGRTVLIDFDLARRYGAASGRGTTPFVAPEVLGLGGPVDGRADIYSLAATFVTLLGGTVAPADAGAAPVLPEFDHPLVSVLGAMLERDVANRPAGGRDVLARLRALGCDAPDETVATTRARILHPAFVLREGIEAKVLDEIPVGRARPGAASVVALKGSLGVGKTRLLDRLKTAWRAGGLRVLVARPGHGHAGTLGPIRDLTRRLARLEGEAGEGAFDVLRTGDRFGLFDRLGQRLLKAGRTCRTVFAFDDVHRFDRASRDFLVHFFRQLSDETMGHEGGVLKAVVTYEPAALADDPLRSWLDSEAESGVVASVAVEPFTESESARFVHQVAQPRALPAEVVQALVARSGGTPLFLRESVASYLEGGSLPFGREAGAPATVEALISGRLDRLPPDERRVLDWVALCPGGIPRADLRKAVGGDPVDAAVGSLLLREELSEHGGRLFVPGAFRVQVVDRVPRDAAVRMHAGIAQALRDSGSAAEDLAWHLLRAGRTDEGLALAYDAVPALRDAGLEEEAIRLLAEVRGGAVRRPFARRWAGLTLADLWIVRGQVKKAREILIELARGSATPDPAVAIRLARVAFLGGDHVEARRALARVLALDAELSPDDRSEILIELAELLNSLGHPADAREALDPVAPIVEAAVPHALLLNDETRIENVRAPRFAWPEERAPRIARYLLVRADVERAASRFVASLKCGLAALKLASRLGDPRLTGRASHAIGTAYMAAGRHDLAERWFRRALPIRRECGDLVGVADTANNLGVLLRKGQKQAEAIEHFTISLRLRRQIGQVAGEGYAYLNIANVYYERRELDAASRYLQRALHVARRLNDPRGQAQVLNNLGAVAQLRYRLEDAIRCYEEAEALFRLIGDEHGAMNRWLNLADLRIVAGQLGVAERLLRVVSRLNRRRGHADVALRLLLLRSRWHRARGESSAAGALLSEAVRRADAPPDVLEEVRIDLAFTELLCGRFGGALDLARTIADAATSPEAPAWVAVIRGMAALSGGEDAARQACADLLDAARFASSARLMGLTVQVCRTLGSLYRELNERPRALNAFLDAFEAFETIVRGFREPELLESWTRTRPVTDLEAELGQFTAEVMKGRAEGAVPSPPEVVRRMKDALFDVERAIGPIHREAQKRGESIRRILQIARALSSTAPVDDLLEQVVDGVIDFSGAERAFIVLVDERGRIRIPVARDRDREAIASPESQISRRIVDEVVRRRTSLRFDNAMTEGSLTSAASVANLELRSVMCAPLLAGSRVFGLLYVDNRSRTGHFGDVDLDLLDIFAVQVAIALENARLVREFVRDEKLKVMGNLTGGVAHDFNNLLAAILGRVQDLLGRQTDPAIAGSLRTIETAAKDGAVIVRRLQDFTRVRRETEFSDLDVAGLLDDVVEFTRSRWEGAMLRSKGRIEVARDVPAGLFVRGHGAELREVFTNIVLNAIAAMPEGGRLSLSATATPLKVTVMVGDSGVGMTEDVRENIFDPYFTTRGADGMGLGMSIVYGIVARHQGAIRVESRVGEGTRIFVELPRSEERVPRTVQAVRTRTSHRNRRVLVVEDEPSVRAVLCDILRGAGYQVEDAPGGREAVAAFEARRADVVLTDLGMVPLNGWDVAQAVKRTDPAVAVILVTGWGAEIDLRMARENSVDFLLQKPFDLGSLVRFVDDAIDLTDGMRASGPSRGR